MGRDLVNKNSFPPPLESLLCSYCFNRIKKGKAFGWKIFFLFDAQSFFLLLLLFFFAVNMRVLGRVFFMSDVCVCGILMSLHNNDGDGYDDAEGS